MPNALLINRVKDLLEENKVDSAFDDFKSILSAKEYGSNKDIKAIYDTFRTIKSEYNRIEDNVTKGVTSIAIGQAEINQIVFRFLKLCNKLEKEIENIDKINASLFNSKTGKESPQIPLMPVYAAAGNGGDAFQSINEKDIIGHIPFQQLDKNKEYLAIKVSGDSMMPRIENEDILIYFRVFPNEIIDGKIYVIIDANTGEVNVKCIYVDKKIGKFILKSYNPKYKDKIISEEGCSFWEVTEIRRKL